MRSKSPCNLLRCLGDALLEAATTAPECFVVREPRIAHPQEACLELRELFSNEIFAYITNGNTTLLISLKTERHYKM